METLTADKTLLQVLDYQSQGRNWEAMKLLKEMTQKHPSNAHFHKLLGNIYFHMGLLDWAIDYYQRAIERDPDYIDAHYDLGVAYYHRAAVGKAIAEYQTVLKLDPEYHAAHYRIGLCYKHVGQLNVAINHLMESTVVTPEYVMAHFHLGEIYFETGEYNKASAAFQRVLEADPDDTASAKYLSLIGEKRQSSEQVS